MKHKLFLTKLFLSDVKRDGLVRAYRFWRIESGILRKVKG